MWIFLSGAYVMPCSAQTEDDATFTLDGARDLQVRGRLTEHLEQFIADFMEPYGLDYSEILQTPDNDYNCRFWTTKEAFSTAMTYAIQEIDYRHFKPTSERTDGAGEPLYRKAKQYHDLLLSIWVACLKLAPAGGPYRHFSDGYVRSSEKTSNWNSKWDDGAFDLNPDWDEDMDSKYDDDIRGEELLDQVADLPRDQWDDALNTEDHLVLMNYIDRYPNVAKPRSLRRRAKRLARRF